MRATMAQIARLIEQADALENRICCEGTDTAICIPSPSHGQATPALIEEE
jgi:hypothetical protein